jgi:hypothetical protein
MYSKFKDVGVGAFFMTGLLVILWLPFYAWGEAAQDRRTANQANTEVIYLRDRLAVAEGRLTHLAERVQFLEAVTIGRAPENIPPQNLPVTPKEGP